MNVIRSNVADRNRGCPSPNVTAEPVGIQPRNYPILHLATAKRHENLSTGHLVDSGSLFTHHSGKIGALGIFSDRSKSIPSKELQIENATSSSSTKQRSTEDSSSSNFLKYLSNLTSTNKPFSTVKTSTSKHGSSLKDAYPHLFRNISKSPSLKSPKETSRKTPRSSTRTSSRTPKTSKTVTSDSYDNGSHTIVAISEGRGQARGEIGIAALDVAYPHLILCQISDTQTYSDTLIKINVLNPVEIVLPHTFCDGSNVSKLYTNIKDTFPSATLTLVHRRFFNDGKGLQQIKNICATEYVSVEMLVSHKFYALCATSALLRYVEYKRSTVFLPKSLKIEYQGPHNSTIIDVDSAHRLELVKSCSGSASQNCLLGVINRCRTNGGVRLLRANILEPPCSLEKILNRLECVQELVSKPELLHSLQNILGKVSNADRLLALCMHSLQQDSLRAAEQQMNYVLLLKTTLEQIPILSTSLEKAESKFLCTVREDLENIHYSSIMKRILETIQEEAHIAKNYITAQYQRCFAVKQGVNGLLDVARKTYSELIEDMIEMVQKVGESCGLPVALKFNALRGFHMQLVSSNKRTYKESDLPPNFIQVQKRRNSLTFTTQELVHADDRCNDVRNEIQMMSNVVIFKLLVDIRDHIGCLYKLCENFAYLDMLFSFAKLSSLPNFVLPKFGDKLELKESRHPILEFINPVEPVSNDIFASMDSNVYIITGPNMSGKSIYIRQIVLLQVLAQIGCYVPAQEAMFRISDRIFTRIGFDDSIECNASTFVLEIREVQYILQTMTSKSLIIMDELCRGTSSEEGTAVAWALCESLIQTDAFVFLTTHFMLLTELEGIYTNVKNYHFEVLDQEENSNKLTYSHRLLPGPTESDLYGIHLAHVLGMPEIIVKQARNLFESISGQGQPTIQIKENISDDRLYLQLHCGLMNILKQSSLSRKECIELKYKLFPSVTTSDELIEIEEIVPSSSRKREIKVPIFEDNKNYSLDEISDEENILSGIESDKWVKDSEEFDNQDAAEFENQDDTQFENQDTTEFENENTEEFENKELTDDSSSDESNFLNSDFQLQNKESNQTDIESNEPFDFFLGKKCINSIKTKNNNNKRTILEVLDDVAEEN